MYINYREFLSESSWSNQYDRDFYYKVDPQKYMDVMYIVGLFIAANGTEFGGFEVKPSGTDAIVAMRMGVIDVLDFQDIKDELKKSFECVSKVRIIPMGLDMVFEVTVPNFYQKIKCQI